MRLEIITHWHYFQAPALRVGDLLRRLKPALRSKDKFVFFT